MQTMFILQGAPGSGKTTVAEMLTGGRRYESVTIRSTDDQHHIDGVYVFQLDKLGEFHRKNQELVRKDLEAGHSVIVDNCNIKAWEAKPYVLMAVERNIPVVFIRCEGKFENVHGVPEEKVERMRNEMEELSTLACVKARRPSSIPQRYLTRDIVQYAAFVYESAQKGLLCPVSLGKLADKLEAAGYQGSVLSSLRAPCPRYRGFWALDEVLCE